MWLSQDQGVFVTIKLFSHVPVYKCGKIGSLEPYMEPVLPFTCRESLSESGGVLIAHVRVLRDPEMMKSIFFA